MDNKQLDLWEIIANASLNPLEANVLTLINRLPELGLSDGGQAFESIAQLILLRATLLLEEDSSSDEPIVDDEEWSHLYQQTMSLNMAHLFYETTHSYPEGRKQSQAILVTDLDLESLIKSEIQVAHYEDLSELDERIQRGMDEKDEMPLLDLQKQTNLLLPDLWYGLLFGNTGYLVKRINHNHRFYDQHGIFVYSASN